MGYCRLTQGVLALPRAVVVEMLLSAKWYNSLTLVLDSIERTMAQFADEVMPKV
jgi:hypothetical protein